MALLGPGVTQVVMAKAMIARYSIVMLRIRMLVSALFRALVSKQRIGQRARRIYNSPTALISFSVEVFLRGLGR